jgi:tetratricopeptide (TPR) repeat protein
MKRNVLIVSLGVATLVAVSVAGWMAWNSAQRRARIEASIPARPDLNEWPAELAQRITDCEERARRGDDAIAGLDELSRLYHANGFYPEASQLYAALLQLDPDNPRWPHRLAHILAGFGRIEDAMPLWRQTLAHAPDYIPALLRVGDALLKVNQNAEAAEVYASVLRLEPRNPYALLGLGRIDVAAERWAQARERLESAVMLSNYELGYDLLPTVYERLGTSGRGEEIRARSKASGAFRDPADPWLDELHSDCYDAYRLSLLGGNAQRNGDMRGAVAILERALKFAPDSAPIHYQLGMLFVSQREFTRARPRLEECIRLAPDFADGWAQLAHLQWTVGDRAAFERTINEGIVRCPDSAGLRQDRGRRLLKDGKTDAAIADFREAIRLRPQEAGAYLDLALAYGVIGRNADAAVELRRALQAEPENPDALEGLAIHAINVGDAAEARDFLRRVLSQPRISPETRESLRQAYTQKFGPLPR